MAFNEAQKRAIRHTDGPALVLAGPGSGKTTVITNRVRYLTEKVGVEPGNILVITFTRAAAREMKERYERITGTGCSRVSFGTFHSVFFMILKLAYRYQASNIVKEEQRIQFIREQLDQTDLEIEDEGEFISSVLSEISLIKGELMSLDNYYAKSCSQTVFKELYDGYEHRLRKQGLLDFDDMLAMCYELFKERKDILQAWQRKYKYILIDEFQDINQIQYEIVKMLALPENNLFIVGDDDQSIYRFRGARPELMLGFEKDYPDAERILLDVNYRCVDPVIESAGKLIANNKTRFQKEIHGNRGKGCPVFVKEWPDPLAETKAITEELRDYHQMGIAYEDMAVLYRAHYITRGVEEVLLKEKIPYTIYSGVQFFARAEIKDALSYLRMIACRDDLSFLRIANVPKRNLGERRMAFLKDYAAQNGCSLYDALRRNLDSELLRGTKGGKFVSLIESFTGIYDQMPVSELLAAVLNESGYEAMLRTEGSQMRLDNLAELKQSVYTYETTCGEECTLEHYLAHVALFTNADLDDPRDQVRLMTVHSAKGLEFPHVFLCAMNEGIFPSKKTRTLPGMEEERRLCFVAMTRAQKALYLSEAEGRNLDGSPRYPSRFLLDIDDSLLTFTHTPREDLIRQAREYIGFSTRLLDESGLSQGFAPGTRVRHAVFGLGTVLERDPAQNAQLVQFDSMPTPRLISLRTKLERE